MYLGFPYPVTAALLLLAVWFWFDPMGDPRPDLVRSEFDASRLSTEPARAMMTDPPTIEIGGVTQRCSACHGMFDSTTRAHGSPLRQHRHIELRHGMNDRCTNCHGRGDHNRLVGPNGDEIPFDRAQELCAQCHGTTYRDWQAGMHGRTNGSWDPTSGRQHRLRCTECHDPHAPAFAPIVPMPAPNTLRQGPQDPDGAHEHHGVENPLMKWKHARDHAEHQGEHE